MYVVSGDEGSSHYNQGTLYIVEGNLDVQTLQQAVNAFVERHGGLILALVLAACFFTSPRGRQ
jgi:hypothetical protein